MNERLEDELAQLCTSASLPTPIMPETLPTPISSTNIDMAKAVMISQELPMHSPMVILPLVSPLSPVTETSAMLELVSNFPCSSHPVLGSPPMEDQTTHIEELEAT
eukprot:c44120_g1_i1 orf=176-493(+)